MATWPMCSTPPITNTSPWPVMICAAAACSACIDEPHRRLTVWPGHRVRQPGEQQREAGHVEGLLERLLHAAPDHVLDLVQVRLGVAAQQRLDHLGREHLGADVAEHAALGAAHGGADGVDDDDFAGLSSS